MNVEECETYLRRKGMPAVPTDKSGFNEITHDYVVKMCVWCDGYETPQCNEKLYLNYKGKPEVP